MQDIIILGQKLLMLISLILLFIVAYFVMYLKDWLEYKFVKLECWVVVVLSGIIVTQNDTRLLEKKCVFVVEGCCRRQISDEYWKS